MPSGRDFYAILGVPRDADDDAIKKAYKKMAIKWHPDKHASKSDAQRSEAEENFKDIAEAMEVLSDKNKRAIYDQFGEPGLKGERGPGGMPSNGAPGASMPGMPGNVHFSFSSGPGMGGGMDAARAQELFSQIFGSHGGLAGGLNNSMMIDDEDPFESLLSGHGISGMMGRGMMGGGRMSAGMMGGGQRRPRAPPRTRDRPDRLPQGANVMVVGLKEDGQQNGRIGRVEQFSEDRGRYIVALEGAGHLAVRPENVRQVLTDARIVGVKNQEGLNGRIASTVTYDTSSKRYKCEGLKGDHTVVALKPENVMLPTNSRVVVDGVQSRPALNGMVGSVVDVDTDRYVVQLPDQKLRLRFGAVVAC